MNGKSRAIAADSPGFNDVGRLVNLIFLLMNDFLYQFVPLRQFQIPLERLGFVKTLVAV